MWALLSPAAAHIPVEQFAQGESRWVAYLWLAGMVALVAIIVWMALTGRFRRRGR